MSEEYLKTIMEALQGIHEELERLNDNLECVTGSFKDRSFINVSATVSET